MWAHILVLHIHSHAPCKSQYNDLSKHVVCIGIRVCTYYKWQQHTFKNMYINTHYTTCWSKPIQTTLWKHYTNRYTRRCLRWSSRQQIVNLQPTNLTCTWEAEKRSVCKEQRKHGILQFVRLRRLLGLYDNTHATMQLSLPKMPHKRNLCTNVKQHLTATNEKQQHNNQYIKN